MSRRFVTVTESALAGMLGADLSGHRPGGAEIDGVHFADHLCVVAMGIGIDGTKHPLGLVEGDTENATVVKDCRRTYATGARHHPEGLPANGPPKLDTGQMTNRTERGRCHLRATRRPGSDEPSFEARRRQEGRSMWLRLGLPKGAS